MHNTLMRTHRDILKHGGHEAIAALTGRPLTTVRSWAQRNSIPADLWIVLSGAGLATLDELAIGASRKRDEAA